jgi:hypothetical protein
MKQRNVNKKLDLRIKLFEETLKGRSDVIQCLGTQSFRRPGSRNRHKR